MLREVSNSSSRTEFKLLLASKNMRETETTTKKVQSKTKDHQFTLCVKNRLQKSDIQMGNTRLSLRHCQRIPGPGQGLLWKLDKKSISDRCRSYFMDSSLQFFPGSTTELALRCPDRLPDKSVVFQWALGSME